jgi:formyl-CoA transferase
VRIVEFAHVIAGPLAGTLMADLGAQVVHVEQPGAGDPGRWMGPTKDDTRLWWKVSARNKRSVTLDLRTADGQDVAHDLIRWADVVITNIRYDTLTRWRLNWEQVHSINPRAVMLQVTGNGANTTTRNEPGFGKVGEARSGVVEVTGFADGPPVHTGFSHADAVTAVMGAYAVCASLVRRNDPDFEGEWIDLALFESLFRLVEWQVILHDQLGVTPTRAGNKLAVAPGAVINTYQSSDQVWITVTSATARSVSNVAALLGEPPENYRTVEDQLTNAARLDELLHQWISQRPAAEALKTMAELEVVASRVYTVADIMADPLYAEREDIISIEDPDLGMVRMQGVVPKLHSRPGKVWRTGAALGADNDVVYRDWLGLSGERLEKLRAAGTIT